MFALVISLMAATPGASAPATPVAPVTVTQSVPRTQADPDEQIICRHETPVGSRVPGPKVCATRGQWKTYTQDSKDMVDDIQNRALRVVSPPH